MRAWVRERLSEHRQRLFVAVAKALDQPGWQCRPMVPTVSFFILSFTLALVFCVCCTICLMNAFNREIRSFICRRVTWSSTYKYSLSAKRWHTSTLRPEIQGRPDLVISTTGWASISGSRCARNIKIKARWTRWSLRNVLLSSQMFAAFIVTRNTDNDSNNENFLNISVSISLSHSSNCSSNPCAD